MKTYIILLGILFAALMPSQAARFYVTVSGGGLETGSSWANALPSDTAFRYVMKRASQGDEFWLAAGTYTEAIKLWHDPFNPTVEWNGNGIIIYGGFNGEVLPVLRNLAINRTIIDMSNTGGSVLWIENGNPCTIDGITLTNGSGEGAGLRLVANASQFRNLIITGNDAQQSRGAAIFNEGSQQSLPLGVQSPCFINTLIRNNYSSDLSGRNGNMICNVQSDIIFINTTITNNTCNTDLISLEYNSTLKVYNSIICDNSVNLLYEDGTSNTADFYNSLVKGSGGSSNWAIFGNDNGGNIDDPPLFTVSYHLSSGSPCVNTGLSSSFPPGILPRDLDNLTRVVGTQIDMGAYEFR